MQYDNSTPMGDVLDGVAVANPNAVHAFVVRQSADSIRALPGAAELMRDVLLQAQLKRPDELVAWKTPAQPVSVPLESLQAALNAALASDRALLLEQASVLAFGELVTLQSVACFIADRGQLTKRKKSYVKPRRSNTEYR